MSRFAVLAIALLTSAAGVQAVTLTTIGQHFTVTFDGKVSGTFQPGLTSEAEFTLSDISDLSAGRQQWTFTIELKNTSTSPITASRVSILGFNTDPDVNRSLSSVSGDFDILTRGNMPNVGIVEICLKGAGGANCSGGGYDGATIGNPLQFTANLVFDVPISGAGLYMDRFVVKYQSIVGSTYGNSGTGRGTEGDVLPPVPLPAAFWLFGSGILALLGLRRVRRQGWRAEDLSRGGFATA